MNNDAASPLAALEQAGDSRSADIYWYQTDLNSAPLEVTNAAKRQGAQYQKPLCYAGQYQDDESGLHYSSATTNPRMWVDPLGLSSRRDQLPGDKMLLKSAVLKLTDMTTSLSGIYSAMSFLVII
ncbi:hypothetical protein ABI244_02165 [Serratia ureilytica]|uniref:Uncharacterized protein n=1 Tax=Serratia marcescens TaxID=615 RepID=A0AB35Z3Z4_SERMA|nr:MULTISPECIES: hypothetical protein [Serratia]ASL92749.1 hypothetical protein BVG94_08890 [Serratia marcescens]WDF88275.1 hypothetical protein PTZ17_11535 [Serratia ureilytica]BEN73497.1 hypothetical protein SMKC081_16420 [Serratia marcescens]